MAREGAGERGDDRTIRLVMGRGIGARWEIFFLSYREFFSEPSFEG